MFGKGYNIIPKFLVKSQKFIIRTESLKFFLTNTFAFLSIGKIKNNTR